MAESSNGATFSSFARIIDNRILRAVTDMGFARPTLVQAKAIPLAMEGRDILARARTGSGKTAAYCVPLAQKILTAKEANPSQVTRGLILVPTRELSDQVTRHLKDLLKYCEKEITVANVSSSTVTQVQKNLLQENPDIIVATPSKALNLSQSKGISLSQLETLVVDEADLIFSFGHAEDMRHLMQDGHLPKIFQSFLMSATMTKDVESLQGLVLRDPVMLELDELDDDAAKLTQYVVHTPEVDKFLLTYVMLKLKLIKGKCILFVNDVDRCYRLKLFLEQFSIKSCVLNSELPLNSRVHIVQEFNKGVYDYIIATDESAGKSDNAEMDRIDVEEDLLSTERPDTDDPNISDEGEIDAEQAEASTPLKKRKRGGSPAPSSKKKSKRRKGGQDKEYGVTRGVDFIDVSCVLNFDLPTTSRGYTHRVGRTARAGRTGMSLSFVVPKNEYGKNKIVGCVETTKKDEAVWELIQQDQGARGSKIIQYNFDRPKVEAFRYRMEDALRSVTRSAIKEGRLKDLKNEVLKSDKLKAHFEDNPVDLDYLRHDKPLHPTRVQPHMKNVPKYLLPSNMTTDETTGSSSTAQEGFVPFHKRGARKGRQRGNKFSSSGGGKRKKKDDPLRRVK